MLIVIRPGFTQLCVFKNSHLHWRKTMTLQQAAATGKSARVLVVDDYQPWQVFVSKTLRNVPELEIVGKVSDKTRAPSVSANTNKFPILSSLNPL